MNQRFIIVKFSGDKTAEKIIKFFCPGEGKNYNGYERLKLKIQRFHFRFYNYLLPQFFSLTQLTVFIMR